jgi:hypothetical protein
MGRFTGFLGLAVILGVAWMFSTHKREIKIRLIAWGMGLQFAFALLVLKTDFGLFFKSIGDGVNAQNILDCLAILKENGYKGVLSLECEGQAGPMIERSLAWTRQAVQAQST